MARKRKEKKETKKKSTASTTKEKSIKVNNVGFLRISPADYITLSEINKQHFAQNKEYKYNFVLNQSNLSGGDMWFEIKINNLNHLKEIQKLVSAKKTNGELIKKV